MVQSLKQSREEFRWVLPLIIYLYLKRSKLNNLRVILVCEFLNTEKFVAAYGKLNANGEAAKGLVMRKSWQK